MYSVDVWFKDVDSPNRFDTYALSTYQVGSGCTSATVTSSGGSTQPLGGSSTFTSATTGCSSPSYRWWLLPPSGAWQSRQPYGAGTWSQTFSAGSFMPGTYSVDAWVKQSGSTATYDTYGLVSFSLSGCSDASLAVAPASPQSAGTPIGLTASSNGCAPAEYQFWVLPPGGFWTSLGPYSSSTTATWTTSLPGNYALVVWVRTQGATNRYDTFGLANFSLQ
jgi:hypothetical protein